MHIWDEVLSFVGYTGGVQKYQWILCLESFEETGHHRSRWSGELDVREEDLWSD